MDNATLMAIRLYSIAIYPKLETLGFTGAKAAIDFCQQWSAEQPLWLSQDKGGFAKRYIPGFGEQSSIFAMAVLSSYLVWFQMKTAPSNGLPSSELLSAALDGYKIYALEKGV